MKPTGKEIAVYTVGSRMRYSILALVAGALTVWFTYQLWYLPYTPHPRHSPLTHYMVKFVTVPGLALSTIALVRMAIRKSMKTIWLRVGESGLWIRNLFGKQLYFPWDQVTRIEIGWQDEYSARFLEIHVASGPGPYVPAKGTPLYLEESNSPVPLEQLAEKLCKFPAFAARYHSGSRDVSGQS